MTKNWENAFGYQIYIKSFKDSNNDGIGDLKGITQKLDYIESLGVNFIWICPFYDSPMDDNGYDIRDYYKVDTSYGTIDDLKKLVKEAHQRNIKVIIDLVMNHTSDENEWFVKSEQKIEPYTDYYIWKDGKMVDGKMCPPNNWQSFFSGSAWGYSKKRKQYFLKIFSKKMPDLNYQNDRVFDEMERVISFYKDLDIDGFRVDAIAHIAKDPEFKDAKNIKRTYKSFSNLPNTHAYLKRFDKIFKKYGMITMGELGGDPTNKDILEYTTQGELDMVFSFEQMQVFNNKPATINVKGLYKTLKYKNKVSLDGGTPMLFWLNHDYPRLISKIRDEKDAFGAQICLAGLMYMLKGTPVIYNGEELGMENYPYKSIKEFKDCNAKMLYENSKNKAETLEFLKESSRDNARTIMQWNTKKNAGFSVNEPWNFVNENYKTINAETEEKKEDSMLSAYKKIIHLRKQIIKSINGGKYKFFKKGNVIGYVIKNNGQKIVVVANFGNTIKKLRYKNYKVLYSNLNGYGQEISPYELLIMQSK